MADNIIRTFDDKPTKDLFNVEAIEKGTAPKTDLRVYAETLCLIINAAVLDGDFAPIIEVGEEKTVNAREFIADVVNAYTAIARGECFEALSKTADPMLEAVKQLTFPTIKAIEKKVGEDKQKIPVMSVEDVEKPIDLLRLKLQKVVDAMIGEEFKAVSHDVKFLLSIYSKKNNRKALTVTCANHKYLTMYVAEICHRIVMGKAYTVEYKTIKK